MFHSSLFLLLVAQTSLAAGPDESWRAEAAAARALPLPALQDAGIARWSEWIQPARAELGFEEIPWIASFAEGLQAAERAGRPLLFWAMNGHPLGCT